MSLLLKALQNAAKNREAAGGARTEQGAEPDNRAANPPATATPGELSIEPVQPANARGSGRAQAPIAGHAGGKLFRLHRAPGFFAEPAAHGALVGVDGREQLLGQRVEKHAFQLFVAKVQPDRSLARHESSLVISVSLATLFMLRAVPAAAAGILSFERPTPSSP